MPGIQAHGAGARMCMTVTCCRAPVLGPAGRRVIAASDGHLAWRAANRGRKSIPESGLIDIRLNRVAAGWAGGRCRTRESMRNWTRSSCRLLPGNIPRDWSM